MANASMGVTCSLIADHEGARSVPLAVLMSFAAGAQVDLRASFAAGMIQDGKVFLTPINEAVALRPRLKHLDRTPEPQPGIKAEGASGNAASPQPVTVWSLPILRACSSHGLDVNGKRDGLPSSRFVLSAMLMKHRGKG